MAEMIFHFVLISAVIGIGIANLIDFYKEAMRALEDWRSLQ